MSNQPSTQSASPSGAPGTTPTGEDPRAAFTKAVSLTATVIGAVRPDQLGDPTPCVDFDVRALLAHLVGVLDVAEMVGAGGDYFSVAERQPVADDGWPGLWDDLARQVEAAWADESALTRMVNLPWGTTPAGAALAVWVNDVSVHTWDLATATRYEPTWDPEVLEFAFAAIRGALPMPTRDASIPFGDAVEVGKDAPLIDRLVAWNGRRP